MTRAQKYQKRFEKYMRSFLHGLIYAAAGCVIGALVGLFEALFGLGLEWIGDLRAGREALLLTLLIPCGLLITFLFEKYGKNSKKGIGLVFEISQGEDELIPKRTVSLMMVSTWLSHLAGASVGKEGVGMQIGAAVSHVIGRNVPAFRKNKTIFLVTGMAAGFAGLFGTPFTAIFFALEVLIYGQIEFKALAPAAAAAFCAAKVSSMLGLGKEALAFRAMLPDSLEQILIPLLLMGVLFGITGGLFAWCMHHFKDWVTRTISNPYVRVASGSIGLGLALWLFNDCRYCGSGMNLISAAMHVGIVYPWDFVLKFALSVFSLSIGFIGGEVTPLFAIGSTLGIVIAPWCGLDPRLCAALGYAAVFGAGTNTWLAPMMIGMEMFGYEYFPLFFVVCAVANLANGNLSIYSLQQKAHMPD